MDHVRSIIDAMTIAQAFKWALVVLVAGFIGQFGRKFAEYLIERARRKKKATAAAERALRESRSGPPETSSESVPQDAEGSKSLPDPSKEAKTKAKLEKKMAKAKAKQLKKAAKGD